jgi:propanol-preferring alcohol dehydrogenase
MAIQILDALSPARVVAVDVNAGALELAHTVGAAETVPMDGDAVERVRAATNGIGADVVLDFVGTDETLRFGAGAARSLGHLTVVGIGGGTLPLGFFTVPYELSVATTYWGSIPELIEVIALARAGKIRAHVQQFSLDDAASAYERMRAGELHGRAVVVPQ